jgi:hypothetical protein
MAHCGSQANNGDNYKFVLAPITGAAQLWVMFWVRLRSKIIPYCRLIYQTGVLLVAIGAVVTFAGLVIGLCGKGWITFFVGIGCVVFGWILGQVALHTVTNEMKLLVQSVTAKQASELAARHLNAKGDDADNTEVFLGQFIADMEWQERQNSKQGDDT